jgi:hypothetical protein
MHNTKFIVTCVILAIGANIAIIGCNRQSEKTQKSDDSASVLVTSQAAVPSAQAISEMQQQSEISHNSPSQTSPVQNNPYEKAKIEVKTFIVDAPATGYGYDILINGDKKIHQYNIPGVPGNNGFSSESKAHKAGEYIASKIRHNIMPPAVNAKELDSLGVLN